jgi:hypothetical protein
VIERAGEGQAAVDAAKRFVAELKQPLRSA